ncbi:MAG TPA: phosphoglycerate dehydrogenase [Dehalococcoidia bacterium]|nr:phosphoglycerate dehydrogenase [Dehalococcoidia bacterium]
MNDQHRRVLVTDPLADAGLELLSRQAEVDVRLGLRGPELVAAIDGYDALVVRSETKVTREVIEAGHNLQVIGRAGVGVDNIDLEAATERGIVVVNAPLGNIVSAAEHTIALLCALARNIPQADASLRSGRWERSKFIGVELRGKTLGIVGLGQVGSEVARRARGLEMQVLAYDPFVSPERASVLGVDLVTLDDLLARSDFVTLHTILTEATRGLIGAAQLAKMKPTARLINTARGGLVDEAALLDAVRRGVIAGAAIDVFAEEPAPPDHPFFGEPRIIVTPHLGASTREAQERVAIDVAEQVLAVLRGQPALYAVNAPMIPVETMAVIGPYLVVAEKVASLATQLAEGQLERVEIEYEGDIANYDTTPLRASVIKGLLGPVSEEKVTLVNAMLIAEQRGIRIVERTSPGGEVFTNLVTVRIHTSGGEDAIVSGTLAHDGPRVVRIDGFWVDIPTNVSYLLLCENLDRPGMVGKVGTLLGSYNVNISGMHLGRTAVRGRALMALGLDDPMPPEALTQLRALEDIYRARVVKVS